MLSLKYIILLIFALIGVSTGLVNIEEMYLIFFTQVENIKKSIDILKVRVDVLTERNLNNNNENKFSQIIENFDVVKNSLHNINTRLDVKSDDANPKYQDANKRLDNIETQQQNLVLQLFKMTEKYSLLIDDMNILKESNEMLKQKNIELKEFLGKVEKEGIVLTNELNLVKKSEERLLQSYKNLEAKYLDITKSKENEIKLFLNELKTIKDAENLYTGNHFEVIYCLSIKLMTKENLTKTCMNFDNFHKKTLFDVRTDKLPEIISCIEDPTPIDCKTATKCTQKSGYYKIFIKVNNEDKEILVFCDAKTEDGGWLGILRRHDGSVNFTRSWLDYVKGFGNIETEYWLGLDNIHALTNNYGRQELYVYIENEEGESRFARYDNFIVGGVSDLYQLKSLGNYSGTAGDSLRYNLNDKFSTIDRDNDESDGNCADIYKGGWWFANCTDASPTGYLKAGSYGRGMKWANFGGAGYSHKVMHLMIRSL